MGEPLAEHYLEKLNAGESPVRVLVSFYKHLFDLNVLDKDIYKKFAKLSKIYGSKNVYFSLLDCAFSMKDLNHENIEIVISYFAKKRLNDSNLPQIKSLDKLAKDIEKGTLKKRKLKIKNPFEEEDK